MDQHFITGDPSIFAIEILHTGHKWNNKTDIWLNNQRIGDREDENLLMALLPEKERIV